MSSEKLINQGYMSDGKYKDEILHFLHAAGDNEPVKTISEIAAHVKIDKSVTILLCDSLAKDGYIVYVADSLNGSCKIKNNGINLLRKGGHTEQEIIEKIKNKKARRKEELEQQQLRSVIATNKSVEDTNKAIIDNIPIQRNQGYLSIGVAAISLIFLAVTIYQSCNDSTDEELKNIHLQLKQQSIETRELRNTLERVIKKDPLPSKDSMIVR